MGAGQQIRVGELVIGEGEIERPAAGGITLGSDRLVDGLAFGGDKAEGALVGTVNFPAPLAVNVTW